MTSRGQQLLESFDSIGESGASLQVIKRVSCCDAGMEIQGRCMTPIVQDVLGWNSASLLYLQQQIQSHAALLSEPATCLLHNLQALQSA